MTLHLSYFVPPQVHEVARENGFLDGIDVVETRTMGSEAQFAGLRDGSLDLVVTAIDNLFEWVPRGADVKLVGQVEATTPLSIYAQPSIESLESADSIVFGVDAFSNGFALIARTLLAEASTDVTYVEVGGVRERFDALIGGSIDATLLGPPFTDMAASQGKRELVKLTDVMPDYPGQGLIARSEVIDHPEFHQYMKALGRAGLLEVNRAGLSRLELIREGLNLTPENFSLANVTVVIS